LVDERSWRELTEEVAAGAALVAATATLLVAGAAVEVELEAETPRALLNASAAA
jgi:hypothetical protein